MKTSHAALFITLTLAASALTGCAGSPIVGLYNIAVTPKATVCDSVQSLKLADAEKALNMGDPDAVRRKAGANIRTYTKGNRKAVLTVKDGVVVDAVCGGKDEKLEQEVSPAVHSNPTMDQVLKRKTAILAERKAAAKRKADVEADTDTEAGDAE